MQNKAFTIMEIIIVITLIGIIAGFAIPQYNRSLNRAHERDMINQMIALHGASLVFAAQNDGDFWNSSGAENITANINNALNINLISSDGTTYMYNGANQTFTATATWNAMVVTVTQAPLAAGANPVCTANCP